MGSNYYKSVSFKDVEIMDAFWSPRIDKNRNVTIPMEYELCKRTGRIDAFRLNWKPGDKPEPHVYWDSDVAKWIEAASYSLASYPDHTLEALLQEVIDLVASSQQPDGYLNSHYSAVEPDKRWINLRDNHELYCAGHMIEAGVAHYTATGNTTLLNVVCRYADYIASVFGVNEGQKRGYCGHEEIELALVKLYHATGNKKYLELSSYFVEERGRQPYYFDIEAMERGDKTSKLWYGYMQAHKPVREQEKVTGHAVRAMYLYSAMADLAREYGDLELLSVCERIWKHLCSRQLYVTGGIGASHSNEGFLNDYDLPNETSYCETCASIGIILFAHRMLKIKCDRLYSDVIETALYNGVLCGCSIHGDRFFYANPLASFKHTDPYHPSGNSKYLFYKRSEWFDCSCCPPNFARMIASLGEYIYTYNNTELAVHLYISSNTDLEINGTHVAFHQSTNYPWNGDISIRIDPEKPVDFSLKLRLPGWCSEYRLLINRSAYSGDSTDDNGYICIHRRWESADEVLLKLDMKILRIYSHPDIRYNVNCTAIQRGPVVYCIEQTDHTVPVYRLLLPEASVLHAEYAPELLGGVTVIKGNAVVMRETGWENILYSTARPLTEPCEMTAVPYFLWGNREDGEMKVWINEIKL